MKKINVVDLPMALLFCPFCRNEISGKIIRAIADKCVEGCCDIIKSQYLYDCYLCNTKMVLVSKRLVTKQDASNFESWDFEGNIESAQNHFEKN